MIRKHRIPAVMLLAALLLSLCGCVMVETEVDFSEDGSFTSQDSLYYSSEYFEFIGQSPEDFYRESIAENSQVIEKKVLGTDYYGTMIASQTEAVPAKGEKKKSGDGWTVTYKTESGRKLAAFEYVFPAAQDIDETEVMEITSDTEGIVLARITVSFPGGVKTVDAPQGCRANISGKTAIFEIELTESEQKISASGYLDGKDKADEKLRKLSESNPFSDVTEDDSFFDAVVWAYNSDPQVTDGNGAGLFLPNQTCTRGQVVTFLWRACGCPKPKTSENPFTDVAKTDYFYEPVLWAYEKGITDGVTETTFGPYQTCRHSHVLTFLHRAIENPDPEKAPEIWYSDALAWAKKKGLTQKTGITEANISESCPRRDAVLYLYSSFGKK